MIRRVRAPLLVVCCLVVVGCGNVTPVRMGTGGAGGSAAGTGGTGGAVTDAAPGGSGGIDAGTGGAGGSGGIDAGTGGAGGNDAGPRVPVNHRAAAAMCPRDRSPGVCVPNPSLPNDPALCLMDSDCATGQNGRCNTGGRAPGCRCSYDVCFGDQDCNMGGPCACRAPAVLGSPNVCLKGNCRVDADCAGGGYCSPTFDFSCGRYLGIVAYYCHTPADQCTDDSDCPMNGDCRYNPAVGSWVCANNHCVG